MANMTTTISVQLDTKDKELATEILQKLGVTMSGLINMTIKQVIMRGSIPFEIALPKDETDLYSHFSKKELEETAKELEYIKNHKEEYQTFDNRNDLKKALLSDE